MMTRQGSMSPGLRVKSPLKNDNKLAKSIKRFAIQNITDIMKARQITDVINYSPPPASELSYRKKFYQTNTQAQSALWVRRSCGEAAANTS